MNSFKRVSRENKSPEYLIHLEKMEQEYSGDLLDLIMDIWEHDQSPKLTFTMQEFLDSLEN